MRPLLSLTWDETAGTAPTLLASVKLGTEQDVVLAHQRGRQIAQSLGYDAQNQVRISTAISEIAREGHSHGDVSVLEFGISNPPQFLLVRLTCPISRDSSDRQKNLTLAEGFVMARKILGHFRVEAQPDRALYLFGRALPPKVEAKPADFFAEVAATVGTGPARTVYQEYQTHNQELLEALNELRRQRLELAKVNRELEETNRGVVALYSELEEKADSLRRANEQRSRFYSSISHEFRTPVTSILSLSQILLNRLDGELSPEQDRQVSLIQKCGQNLLDWVNDLLDLARADAGRLELRLTDFTLADLLSGLRGIMRPLADKEEVALRIECPPALAEMAFHTDEVKLSQILRNFVSNALKFTEHGEVSVVPETETAPAGTIVLIVRDTGIGIAPEDQARIFDEFVQIDSPLQRKTKGTGLGLPLSKRLAELLGGRIEVTSVVGEGTTFRLTVPLIAGATNLVPAEAEPTIDQPSEIPAGETAGSSRVLLIDDDLASRYLLAQVLTEMGVQSEEAATGAEGLVLAERLLPKAIFLDLVMPDLHGVEVLEALKQSSLTRNIPVIVYSSQTSEITDFPQWKSLASAILEKPTGPEGPPRSEIERALSEAGIPASQGSKATVT